MVLTGGSVVGQIIGLLATPVLTRLYTPDEYGVMGVYVSVLGILTVVAMLRYEAAIPISDTEPEALNVLALACGLAVVTSLACACAVLVAAQPLTTLFRVPELAPVAWLLPIGMLGYSVYRAFSLWAVRQQDFRTLASTKVTQGMGLVSTQLGLGFLRAGPSGLIVGQIVGHSAGIAALGRRVQKQNPGWSRSISFGGLSQIAGRYSRFPKLSLWAALLYSTSNNLPLLFLGTVLSTTIAGWYTLVQQTLLYPLNLLYVNTGQVYYSEIARLKLVSPQTMQTVFVRRVKQAGSLALAVLVLINLIVPWFVPLVFGTQWSGAVTCLQIISPMVFAAFLGGSTGSTLEVLQRQDLHVAREALSMVMLIGALAIAYLLRANWVRCLAVISAAEVVIYAFSLWLSWFAIRSYTESLPVSGITTLVEGK
jgi:O-antigen/teichoic acid export membrane protein